MIQSTSREAYHRYARGGQAMQADYDAIIHCLALIPSGLTRHEVAEMTGIPINRVTGRVHELIADGVITVHGRRASQTTGYVGEVIQLTTPSDH